MNNPLVLIELSENTVLTIFGLILTGILALAGALWRFSGKFSTVETKLDTHKQEITSKVDNLERDFRSYADDLYEHTSDANVHTTFEYRQSVNARFDKIEATITHGHNILENKIDKLIDWALKK